MVKKIIPQGGQEEKDEVQELTFVLAFEAN